MNKKIIALVLVLGVVVTSVALLQVEQQQTPQSEISTYEGQLDELENFLDFLTSWENIDLSGIEGLTQ